jgi:hypothetical protein
MQQIPAKVRFTWVYFLLCFALNICQMAKWLVSILRSDNVKQDNGTYTRALMRIIVAMLYPAVTGQGLALYAILQPMLSNALYPPVYKVA